MITIGLDAYLIAAKNRKIIEEDKNCDWLEFEEIRDNPNFWDGDEFKWPQHDAIEMWYSRKFWSLIEGVPALREGIQKPDDICLINKETLRQMIEYHSFHPDYFDGFTSLPALCELYQLYDEIQANGLKLYFCASY